MTWNILGAQRPDLGRIAAEIRAHEPDVVALQEVQRHQAVALARHLGYAAVWTRKHYPYSPLVWWRAEGLAVLAPTSLDGLQRWRLSVGEPIWIHRHRVMLAATVRRGDDRLGVYNVHLASTGTDERIAQAARAARLIAHERVAPRVVTGDLNAPDEVEVIREFHAIGVRDNGADFTNPSETPVQRLDYVLVPDDAVDVSTVTPVGGAAWRELSDHLPVVAEFTVPG